MEILRATLRHAAVNVNFFSTMTLDFALCDRPVVNVAIETPQSRAARVDVAGFYEYEHYRPVLEERAARLVRSIDELCDAVSAYLRDPSYDRAERRRLVERLCGPVDGRADARIAAELADLAQGRPPRP
jgi:CDP-glycerol glycerophosphotransferase (TagB/SpsB family)